MGNKLSHHFFLVFSVESGKSSPFNKNRYVCFGFVNDLLLPLTFITDTWVRTANMLHLLQGILITNDDGDDDDDDDDDDDNNNNNNN